MLRSLIENYQPINMQEEQDKKVMLKYLDTFDDCLTRKNEFGHFTSSSFVVNQNHTKVLMAYHNIYKSYSWLGGHVDGCEDTLKVAIKETKEETSIKNLKLLTPEIVTLDVIEVCGHIKNQKYVTPHVHLNVTYLFEANDKEEIHEKIDENLKEKIWDRFFSNTYPIISNIYLIY